MNKAKYTTKNTSGSAQDEIIFNFKNSSLVIYYLFNYYIDIYIIVLFMYNLYMLSTNW